MDFILIVKFLYFSFLLLINYTFENFIYSLYYIIFKNPSSLKKSPSAKAKGLVIIWLFEWLSQSVLLWDKISLEMKRVRTGHIEKLTQNKTSRLDAVSARIL